MNSSIEELVDRAPAWIRNLDVNNDLDGIPNRWSFAAFPPTPSFPNGEKVLMLNADVSYNYD